MAVGHQIGWYMRDNRQQCTTLPVHTACVFDGIAIVASSSLCWNVNRLFDGISFVPSNSFNGISIVASSGV